MKRISVDLGISDAELKIEGTTKNSFTSTIYRIYGMNTAVFRYSYSVMVSE